MPTVDSDGDSSVNTLMMIFHGVGALLSLQYFLDVALLSLQYFLDASGILGCCRGAMDT
jgi:hypothetical protein